MIRKGFLSSLALLWAVASCAGRPGGPAEDSGVNAAAAEPHAARPALGDAGATDTAGGEGQALGRGLQRLVDIAKRDLAATLDIEESAIETVAAQYVTWRDSALGCPLPGYEYLQVLTNGSRIRLRVDQQVFEYHSGGNRPPFLCDWPDPLEPLPYAPGEA